MNSTARIEKSIAATQQAIALMDEEIAEVSALIHEGKANMDDLDAKLAERDKAQKRLTSFQTDLNNAGKRDLVAEEQQRRAAIADAAAASIATQNEIEAAAADAEAGLNQFILSVQHMEALALQLRKSSYDAGATDGSRLHLTDLRAVDAFLADRLSRSGVGPRLEFVKVSGVQHLPLGTGLLDLIKTRGAKMATRINRAVRND